MPPCPIRSPNYPFPRVAGTMPGWLQAIVEVNPITLLVTGVRGLMHGDVTAAQLGWVLLSCVLLIGVFGPLTMRRSRVKN